jgi:hypothetical protein
MNLIEKLAKKQFERDMNVKDKDGLMWMAIADKQRRFKNVKKDILPIFAEWIKKTKKKSPYEPFSENEDIEYRVARTCWNNGFNEAISIILSELEKMK